MDVRPRPSLVACMDPNFLTNVLYKSRSDYLMEREHVSHLYDDRLATLRKKTIERPLVRSNRTREWTAVQFFWEWKAKLEFFLPRGMCFLCLTFTLRRE